MLRLSDSRNFGRTLAAVSLVVGPLLLLVGQLVGPDLDDDAAGRLAEIPDHEGTYVVSAVLFLLAAYTLIPGVLGIMRLLRGRGVTFGQVAAGLLLLGILATTVFYGFTVIEYEAARPGLERAQMAKLIDNSEDSGLGIPVFLLFLAGIVLGAILVAVALWRRGVVPPWAALSLGASGVLGFFSESKLIGALAFVLLLIGFGAVAHRLLETSDEEWGRWTVDLGRSRSAADAP